MQLSYLDAYYYKLLLQVGFVEDVNNWILSLAQECDVLEGIYLDLVSNQGDNSKVISCLHNYICEKDIDDDALVTKLRLFILNKYESGSIDICKVAESLTGFVNLTEKWHCKPFYNFVLISDALDLYYDGIMRQEKFNKLVIDYLKTGETVNYNSSFEKPSLLKIFKQEKQEMNKIRVIVNYTVVPSVLIITVIILATICITMEINEEKYTILSIILFSVLGLIYAALLLSVPFIRKKELEIELSKYNFNIDDDVKEEYIVESSSTPVVFKKDGLYFENKHYKYEDLYFQLMTSNYLLKITIKVYISVKNSDSFIKPHWNMTLDKELVNAILKYNIKLDNHEQFIYLINNKEDAFKQIYNYGYVKKIK